MGKTEKSIIEVEDSQGMRITQGSNAPQTAGDSIHLLVHESSVTKSLRLSSINGTVFVYISTQLTFIRIGKLK